MELIINCYQEKADQTIDAMLKAMDQHEATQDSDWLLLAMELEAQACFYLSLVEKAREFI